MHCEPDLDLFLAGVLELQHTAEEEHEAVDLHRHDHIVHWSSGGKDSLASLAALVEACLHQRYPLGRITVAHNNLGHEVEWHGTMDLARRQAAVWGLRFAAVRRRDGKLLIDHVAEKGMWPDQKRRWCTSDHKRGPGLTLLTRIVDHLDLGRTAQILQTWGFRAAEGAGRKKRVQVPYLHSPTASGKAQDPTKRVRDVWDWYPIAGWSDERVWDTIHDAGLPYHWAYARGMRRLSCTFCVMADVNDLIVAAKLQPAKAARYLQVELNTGHTFKQDVSMRDVVHAAGWDEDYLLAILAGDTHTPICPACAATLDGTPPTQIHEVPDDVATAMFGRPALVCNGDHYLDADLLVPVSPFVGLEVDDGIGW